MKEKPAPEEPTFGAPASDQLLRISDAHALAMFRYNLLEHLGHITRILREVCSLDEAAWPGQALERDTLAGIDRALALKLASFEDVVGFLVLRHSISNRFDELPMIRDFFRRTDLPAEHKLQFLMSSVPFSVWGIIQRRLPSRRRGA